MYLMHDATSFGSSIDEHAFVVANLTAGTLP
jgi:hypothetical protein